jgi:hypothetical protein
MHKQVRVRFGERSALVDVELAPLIEALWKRGIGTILSCQENRPGWVWIAFETVADAEAFLNLVTQYEEDCDSLYNRIRHGWDRNNRPVEGFWEYNVHPSDLSVEQWENSDGCLDEKPTGPVEFCFSLSVRFPVSDLQTVLNRVRGD